LLQKIVKNSNNNEPKNNYCTLHCGDDRCYRQCGYFVFQKSLLGTLVSKHWHCVGVYGFLSEVFQELVKVTTAG
jgi:hypothetical protein